jgi:hypothetical protein
MRCHEEANGHRVEPNYSDPEAAGCDRIRDDLRSVADIIQSVASGSGPFPEPHRVYLELLQASTRLDTLLFMWRTVLHLADEEHR